MTAGPLDLGGSPHATLRPVDGAEIGGGVWADRQRLNREKLLTDGARRLEEAGSFHNLRVAAGEEDGEFRGMLFSDSDVHKWLEALGWELGREPSAELAGLADECIRIIEAAQQDDGYLNSYYQVVQPAGHFVNLAFDHELYCAGHLIQAAVAHARGRGDTRLLGVARRLADHIGEVFGPGRNEGTPGHPEIEMALVELSRLTGEPRYRELAAFLVGTRGHGRLQPAHFGSAYFQDHAPMRETTELTGHCVRAVYLAAGVTDLYLETGEAALLDVMQAQWHDMVARKSYLTGALGARHSGEAFGDPYELPPDRCYGETCAAIASMMWSWRMLLVTGDARFADVFERTLYNGFIAGLALDGTGYAYVNPLHVRDGGELAQTRYPWFPCACCPPNVMRTLASLQHYLATADAGGVQIHQYATGRLRAGAVELRVATDYPWDGHVELEVAETGVRPWTLSLRVPAWAAGATLAVNDEPLEPPAPGSARIERAWRRGDRVVLALPVAPRLTAPHPRVDAVRGCLAIERGPLVYCLEGGDAPAGALVDDLRIDPGMPLRSVPRPDLLGGIVAVGAGGAHRPPAFDAGWIDAGAAPRDGGEEVELLAVPYALWGNRGSGAMRVWIPTVA
jgi:DUF1680 family protein